MDVKKVVGFPRGASGKKGVCGRSVESPYGKAVMISVPVNLVPFIRIVVSAISYMQSIGVSILPGILTIVAQQIAVHGQKANHKMRDVRPLVTEMVEAFQEWDGAEVGLSDLDSLRSCLELVLDAVKSQEPMTEQEVKELARSAKKGKLRGKKSANGKSASNSPRRKRSAVFRGFGGNPGIPENN